MVQGVDYRIPMSAKGLDLSGLAASYLAGQQNKRQNELLELTQKQKEQEMAHLDDESRFKSIAGFAVQIKPFLDAGDHAGAQRVYNQRIAEIQSRGGNPSDSMELAPLLMSGDLESAKGLVDSVIGKAQQMGYLGKPNGSTNSTADIQNYNFYKSLSPEEQAAWNHQKRQQQIVKYGDVSGVVGEGGNFTPIQEGNGQLTQEQLQTLITEQKAEQAAEITRQKETVLKDIEKAYSQKGQVQRLDQAREIVNNLMPKGDGDLSVLSRIYGRGESLYPSLFRSQEGIDAMAERTRLVSMLKLGARGELKGQGPITEGEQGMLGAAITILEQPDISPEIAGKYITQALSILGANAGVSAGSGGGYQVGQIIEVNGQKYRVIGGDSNDPEVELAQ